jgi:hypothetical protein
VRDIDASEVVKNGVVLLTGSVSVLAQITAYNLKCHKYFAILTMLVPMDRIVRDREL